MYTLSERARIVVAWLLSFRRRDWQLADYPVVVKANAERDPAIAWSAHILNWPGPAGLGASPGEARENLEACFTGIAANRTSMPRPGTWVPVEFAPSDRVNADPALLEDFVSRVLQQGVLFVSDQSSLFDFGDDDDVQRMRGLIRSNFGVETIDLEHALLSDILERIRNERARDKVAGS